MNPHAFRQVFEKQRLNCERLVRHSIKLSKNGVFLEQCFLEQCFGAAIFCYESSLAGGVKVLLSCCAGPPERNLDGTLESSVGCDCPGHPPPCYDVPMGSKPAEIAVFGWGSLIWCPGALRLKTKWRLDGPRLPIEFARISGDGRLTLVIQPDAEDQQVCWSLSEFDGFDDAVENLQEREGCELRGIHSLTATGKTTGEIPATVKESVRGWLAARGQLSAAIWTGLTTNWQKKRRQKFTSEDAVRYLKELESERERAATTFNRAREYVKNAPSLIQTRVRRAMQQEGWKDTELAKILFED